MREETISKVCLEGIHPDCLDGAHCDCGCHVLFPLKERNEKDAEVESLKKERDELIEANNGLVAQLLESQAREMRLRETMKEVGNAFGCFAGCTGSFYARDEANELKHTPTCRKAKEALNQSAPPIAEVLGKVEGFINLAIGDIGVPQPGYPTHIADAYDLLKEALAALQSLRGSK